MAAVCSVVPAVLIIVMVMLIWEFILALGEYEMLSLGSGSGVVLGEGTEVGCGVVVGDVDGVVVDVGYAEFVG